MLCVLYQSHISINRIYIYICVIFPHTPRGQCKSFVSVNTQAATSGNVLKYSIQAEWCCQVSIKYQTVLNTLSVEISGRESACMTLFIFWYSSHRILTSSLMTDIYSFSYHDLYKPHKTEKKRNTLPSIISSWHHFDKVLQCHIYLCPELHSFFIKILFWWWESQAAA